MSTIKSLQFTSGGPAGPNPMSEEEKRKRRGLPPKGSEVSPQELLRRKKAAEDAKRTKPGEKRAKNPIGVVGELFDKVGNEIEWGTKQIRKKAAGAMGVDEEELKKRDAKGAAFRQKIDTQNKGATKDAVRAVVGAPARAAEGIVDTTFFVGDVLRMGVDKTRGIKTDPSRNPFHVEYVEPRLNTGLAVPDSDIGKAAQNLITFGATMTVAWRRAPQALRGKGAVTKFLRAEAASAVADVLLTKKGDPNLTGFIKQFLPEEMQNNQVLEWLASDADDTAVSARAKAVVEGVGISGLTDIALPGIRAAIDSTGLPGAFSTLLGIKAGRKAARAAKKAGKSTDEALDAGVEAATKAIDEDSERLIELAQRESDRWDSLKVEEQEALEARAEELFDMTKPSKKAAEVPTPEARVEDFAAQRAQIDVDERAALGILEANKEGRVPDTDPIVQMARDNLDRIPGERAKVDAAEAASKAVDTSPSVGGAADAQKAPTDAPEATQGRSEAKPDDIFTDPAAKEAADKAKQLDEAYATAINADIDLGYTPGDLNLLPQERAGTWVTDNAADSIRMDKPMSVLTDAQTKRLTSDGGAAQFVEEVSNTKEVQQIAQQARPGDRDLVIQAAKKYNELLESAGAKEFYDVDRLNERVWKAELARVSDDVTGKNKSLELNEAGILVVRNGIMNTVDKAYRLSQEIQALDEKGLPFGNIPDRMLDNLKASLKLLKNTSLPAGRKVRAYGLPVDPETGTFRPGLFDKDADGKTGFDRMEEIMDQIQKSIKAGDQGEAVRNVRILAAALRASGGKPEKMMAFWKLVRSVGIKDAGTMMINSLFSGPKTQMLSLLGNTYTTIERPISMLIQGGATMNPASAQAGLAGLRATADAIPEALRAFGVVARYGPERANLSSAGKYIQLNQKAEASIKELMARANTPTEKAAAGFLNLFNKAVHNPLLSWPTRLLTAGDEAFQVLLLRQWAAMESMYKASKSGLTTKDAYDGYLKEFNTKIDVETGQVMDPELKEWIAQGTFQGDPQDMVKAFSNFINAVPVLKWFVPVIDTPAEILRYVGKHTPLTNIFTKDFAEVTERAARGDMAAQAKLAVYQGRVGLGMLVTMSAAMYGLSGNLTGYGPPPGTREWKAWKNVGKQPLSIRFGEKWISYQSVEPIATIFGAVGDAVMLMNIGETDAAHNLAAQVQFTIAAAAIDKAMLVGLQDLFLLGDFKSSAEQREEVLLGLVNNTVPMAGTRRWLYNNMQPYRKEFKTATDRMWDVASMGLANKGSIYIDPLTGESELSYAGGYYNSTSPVKVVGVNQDPLKWALEKDGFGYQTMERGPGSMKLDPEESQKIHRLMFEQGLRDKLAELITTPFYQERADSWRRRPYDEDEPNLTPPHIGDINRVWNMARQQAIRTLAVEDELFAEKLQQNAERNRDFKSAIFADPQAPDPSLMNKLNLNPSLR